jgi:hypothetical protein
MVWYIGICVYITAKHSKLLVSVNATCFCPFKYNHQALKYTFKTLYVEILKFLRYHKFLRTLNRVVEVLKRVHVLLGNVYFSPCCSQKLLELCSPTHVCLNIHLLVADFVWECKPGAPFVRCRIVWQACYFVTERQLDRSCGPVASHNLRHVGV